MTGVLLTHTQFTTYLHVTTLNARKALTAFSGGPLFAVLAPSV